MPDRNQTRTRPQLDELMFLRYSAIEQKKYNVAISQAI
jgi:hypothetical protein